MRAVPHGFEGTHGLGRSSDAFVNIVVVTQAKGDVGAEVFEAAAEGACPSETGIRAVTSRLL